jgi:hypothetical protein
MTVSWVTPIASGSSRAGIAGIWAGPETEVTGRPWSSVLLLCRPLRGSRARPRSRAFHRVRLHWAGALCRPWIGAWATPAST